MLVRYDQLRIGDQVVQFGVEYTVADIIVGNLQENDSNKWVYQIFYAIKADVLCYSAGPANSKIEKIQKINLT